jgi:hypothetical protein
MNRTLVTEFGEDIPKCSDIPLVQLVESVCAEYTERCVIWQVSKEIGENMECITRHEVRWIVTDDINSSCKAFVAALLLGNNECPKPLGVVGIGYVERIEIDADTVIRIGGPLWERRITVAPNSRSDLRR